MDRYEQICHPMTTTEYAPWEVALDEQFRRDYAVPRALSQSTRTDNPIFGSEYRAATPAYVARMTAWLN